MPKSMREGVLSPKNYSPFPKNPSIAKFLMQLGRFDELGSGILNVNKYIKAYSGKDNPQFIEGTTFKTIIPVQETFFGAVDGVPVGVPVGAIDGAFFGVIKGVKEKLKAVVEEEGKRIPFYKRAADLDESDRTIERYIQQLREANLIEFRGWERLHLDYQANPIKAQSMNMQELKSTLLEAGQQTMRQVNHFAKLERFIATVLTLTPLILFLADDGYAHGFRDSISNYVYMEKSYWFGSLLTLAGALFIFNGAQHMGVQQFAELSKVEHRFGKGYNILFGVSLFGVLFFDHEQYTLVHYLFAVLFFVGCALAMILTRETPLNTMGDVLGTLTLVSLGVHFLLEHLLWKNHNPFTLLWAEWVGLVLIAIYFIAASLQRDLREKHAGLY